MGQNSSFDYNLPLQAYREEDGTINVLNYMPRKSGCCEIALDELMEQEEISEQDRKDFLYGVATNILNLALLFVEFADGKRESVYYHDEDNEKHFPPMTYKNIVDMYLRIPSTKDTK